MKKHAMILAAVAAAALAAEAGEMENAEGPGAAQPNLTAAPDAASTVDAAARERLAVFEKRLEVAEKTLETVGARLGRTIQPPTATRNFERRMDELERSLTAVERDLKQLGALQREQKQLDNRIRKLESKR